MKTLILEFDDLHWRYPENCIHSIKILVDRYPNIKLSFFTSANYLGNPISNDHDWIRDIKTYIDSNNIKLAVHGYTHSPEEFKFVNYDEAVDKLISAHNEFNRSFLPFCKVFRGPHWGINDSSYQALIDLGYNSIYTHNDYSVLGFKYKDRIKSFIYNWNLKDSHPPEEDILIAHGHTHNVCDNGIMQTLNTICNYLDNNEVQFKFVDEI